MAKLFDTHSHYTDESFAGKKGLIEEIFAGDVGHIVTVAVNAEDSAKCIEIASKYENMYASAGIHPSEITDISDISAEVAKIEKFLSEPKCVAIGEAGLDYHWAKEYASEQKKLFDYQLALAMESGLPIIVHDRDAHNDTLEILKKYRPKGVVHCFSGSVEFMREVEKLGMYIGLGGTVTFKNARKPKEVAAAAREDRLLLETDCPYMAPTPFRGKRCDSSLIEYTAKEIATLRNMDAEKLCDICASNTKELFNL